MEKEFVPYDRALKLKELGLDEPCFAQYYKHPTQEKEEFRLFQDCAWENRTTSYWRTNISSHFVSAPTFSQAFRWFRGKQDLFSKVYIVNFGADEYSFDVYDLFEEKKVYNNFSAGGAIYCGTFDTYEEAELACLDKLIEIVESKSK